MHRFADWIDRLDETIGRALAFVVLALVLGQFAAAMLRAVFGVGSVVWQEGLLVLFAGLVALAASDALRRDAHRRVELWYGAASPRARSFVDLAGTVLFLWPVSAAALLWSWRHASAPAASGEGTPALGDAAVRLLAIEFLLFGVLLALRGLATLLRGGSLPDPRTDGGEA